jgi:hypothetical protein
MKNVYDIPKTYRGHKVVKTHSKQPAVHRPNGTLAIDFNFVKLVKKFGIEAELLCGMLDHEIIEWKLIKEGIDVDMAHKIAESKEPEGMREKLLNWLVSSGEGKWLRAVERYKKRFR